MCNDAHQPKTPRRSTKVLGLLDDLQLAMAVDVLDPAHKIAQRLVGAPSAVANGPVGAAYRHLDHNGVQRQSVFFVLDAPPPQALVGRADADADEAVAFDPGFAGDDVDGLELGWSWFGKGESCDVGDGRDFVEAEEGDEDLPVAAEDWSP